MQKWTVRFRYRLQFQLEAEIGFEADLNWKLDSNLVLPGFYSDNNEYGSGSFDTCITCSSKGLSKKIEIVLI